MLLMNKIVLIFISFFISIFFSIIMRHIYNTSHINIKNKILQLQYSTKQDTKTLTFNQKNASAITISKQINKLLNEKSLIYSVLFIRHKLY